MTGCVCGRGETVISMEGCAAAKVGRRCVRKRLGGGLGGGYGGGGGQGKGRERGKGRWVLHALGATGPVAVVEVEAFALKDECADAVLERLSMVDLGARRGECTRPMEVWRRARRGMVIVTFTSR